MLIYTLTVDGPHETRTTIHTSEHDAVRSVIARYGEPADTIDDLQEVMDRHGICVSIDPHPVPDEIRAPASPAGRYEPMQPLPVLYTIHTDYGSGEVIAEHFPTRTGRLASLIDRARSLVADRRIVPEPGRAQEDRLAVLLTVVLSPARITLCETLWDQDRYCYRPRTPADSPGSTDPGCMTTSPT